MSEPALDPTTLATLLARSAQRWSEMDQVAPRNTEAATLALSSKLYNEYKRPHQAPSLAAAAASKLAKTSTELVVPQAPSAGLPSSQTLSRALMVRRQQPEAVPAKPHNQWKLMRVIAGHVGVPMCVGVDPSNKIFATGAADRTIKIWDLATGGLKMTLTGQHTHTVRSVAFSSRHAFMFSAGEDKRVRCFDLEYNKVVRDYHGHTNGVYALSLHPTLDLLIHILAGHKDSVSSVATQAVDPQVITASEDKTVRLWDLVAGRSAVTLTHHKRGVRALAVHPSEFSFASGSTSSVKKFALPEGRFVHDFDAPGGIVNTLALNRDDVLVAGSDDGVLRFWDWTSATHFQELPLLTQPGSLKSEAVCLAAAFDMTGSRLITANADKSIQMFKEVEPA